MTHCSYDGCKNPGFQKSTGLCRSHVSQLARTGKLKPLRGYRNSKPQSPDGLCIEPGCDDAAQSRGLCPKHLWARHPRRERERERHPKQKAITIMPSENPISKVVKPKRPAPPTSEQEAEIQRLRAEVSQLQRMLTAAEDKPKQRRGPEGSKRTLMLESSLTALVDIIDSRAEVKAQLTRIEDEALRVADELLCQ